MSYKEENLVENNKIDNMNKTINNHILEYKRKFIRSKFDCRIDSMIEKNNKNNKIIFYITFYSEKKDVTHNFYIQCPKPMIENQMLKILDRNPLLIKSLGAYFELIPLLEYIIYKYWGRIDVINKKKAIVFDRNWYDIEPQHPSQWQHFQKHCGIHVKK